MITVDQLMDIKSRKKNGQSIRSIVADTGISRNTVRRSLRDEHPIQTGAARKAPKARTSKLDPFKDYIRKRVQEFDLSAVSGSI
jgi:transposase